MKWKIDGSYEHQTAHRGYICFFDRIRTYWLEIMKHLSLHVSLLCLSLPADGGLAVSRPLSCTQRLAHLSLCQAQGQAADLECFGEFTNLLQVDPVHLAGGGLRVYNTTNTSHFISPLLLCRLPHFPSVNEANIQPYVIIIVSKKLFKKLSLGQILLFIFALLL